MGLRDTGILTMFGDVLNRVTRTNRSTFRTRLQTIPRRSMGTNLARVRVSFVSVGILPPQQLSEVSLQQFVFASPQDHPVPEEALRTPVSIPNVNCSCEGQARP